MEYVIVAPSPWMARFSEPASIPPGFGKPAAGIMCMMDVLDDKIKYSRREKAMKKYP
jgi:hypothetical protein